MERAQEVKEYVLTSNPLYTDRKTDDGIVSPVQSVKGILHTKVQDNSKLSMTVDGKRVTVDLVTDALSDIPAKDKAAFSRAITDGAPVTFTAAEDHLQAHIAGVTRDIIIPVNHHEKMLPESLIDHKENMDVLGSTQNGVLVDFSRYRGAVIQAPDGKMILCSGLIKDSYRDDMSEEKALIGKMVSISQSPKKVLLDIQSLEQNLGKATPEKHVVVLTHRADLQNYTRSPQTEDVITSGKDARTIYHGRNSIAGKLDSAFPGYGSFRIEHPEYGNMVVTTGKKLFEGNPGAKTALDKASEVGKNVEISIDKTGKKVSVSIENGPVLVNESSTPSRPFGLLPKVQVVPHENQVFKGILMDVRSEETVELKTQKGPLLVEGTGGDLPKTTLEKMAGKMVEVRSGKDGELKVRSLEQERKEKGFSIGR